MRPSTTVFALRALSLAALATFAAAVWLGRMAGPSVEIRRPRTAGYSYVPKFPLKDRGTGPSFVRTTTGRLVRFDLPEGQALDQASIAPWRDESGSTQVVGRWSKHRGRGTRRVCEAFGLARFRFPEGELLDHIETNLLPKAPPCWLPGTRVRVVFVAGDGRLYRVEFEGAPGADGSAAFDEPDARPRPLAWAVEGLNENRVFVCDLSQPDDFRFATRGLLLASLRFRPGATSGETEGLGPARLWWLRLDRGGGRVVAAGPLDHGQDDHDRRYPVLACDPQGVPTLAYLEQRIDEDVFRLRLATLSVGGDANLRPLDGPGRVLATDCAPSLPAFSADGRWVFALKPEGRLDRLAVAERPGLDGLARGEAPGVPTRGAAR